MSARRDGLGQKPHFPLVANGQNSHLVARNYEAIQSHIARVSIRNDQLPQIPFQAPANQGVCRKSVDRSLNRAHRAERCAWIVFAQEFERALDMIKRPPGIDYPRHGFGRATETPAANLAIQACTSSAR